MSDVQSRAQIEEEIIETLIGWKLRADALAVDTAAARIAVNRAREMRIWEGKYGSFKDWLENECDITEQWAYRLISSAKVIAAIEDAAAQSPALRPLLQEENVEKLHAITDRTADALKVVSSRKAAKAVLSAIKKAKAVPTTAEVKRELVAVANHQTPLEPIGAKLQNPIAAALILMDGEWLKIRQDMVLLAIKPEVIFNRLRSVVEKLL